jgi:hypothetical protein
MLSSISKQDGNLAYKFVGSDRTNVILFFETARIADSFIAKHRGEVIPDYDNKPESSDL